MTKQPLISTIVWCIAAAAVSLTHNTTEVKQMSSVLLKLLKNDILKNSTGAYSPETIISLFRKSFQRKEQRILEVAMSPCGSGHHFAPHSNISTTKTCTDIVSARSLNPAAFPWLAPPWGSLLCILVKCLETIGWIKIWYVHLCSFWGKLLQLVNPQRFI